MFSFLQTGDDYWIQNIMHMRTHDIEPFRTKFFIFQSEWLPETVDSVNEFKKREMNVFMTLHMCNFLFL